MHLNIIKNLSWVLLISAIVLMIAYPHITEGENDSSNGNNYDFSEMEVKIVYEGESSAGNLVDTNDVDELIIANAKKYGVSAELLRRVQLCENRERNPKKQSDLRYSFTDKRLGIYEGERERSFGLAQINLDYHPTITYAQVIDPAFSIEFLAKNIKKHPQWWSCYSIVTAKYPHLKV